MNIQSQSELIPDCRNAGLKGIPCEDIFNRLFSVFGKG